jgi:hypothetical protein
MARTAFRTERLVYFSRFFCITILQVSPGRIKRGSPGSGLIPGKRSIAPSDGSGLCPFIGLILGLRPNFPENWILSTGLRGPHSDDTKDQRPIKSEVRTRIVRAIALGRSWLSELVSGKVGGTEELAQRENRSKRSVHMLISLAFVGPDIVEALIEGKLSRGIGITKLVGLPSNWTEQRHVLGFGLS